MSVGNRALFSPFVGVKRLSAISHITALLWLLAGGCQRGGPDTRAYQGTIEFDDWVLGFEIGGRLSDVAAKRGAEVQGGQRLAALDTTLALTARSARQSAASAARAQVALLQAGTSSDVLRSLEAQVRGARATEAVLAKSFDRESRLRAGGASTDVLVDDLQGRLERASAERQSLDQRLIGLRRGARTQEIDVATAQAAAADAAVKLEEDRIILHQLSAPASGFVLDVHVKAGEVIAAGAPVVTLGDTQHPFTDVFVPQDQLSGLAVGTPAEVRVDGHSALTGTIETVAQTTEFTPRYVFSERERPNLVVRVRVRIADPGARLHAGVPAFVKFRTAGQGS